MLALGYQEYVVQGGDWGNLVSLMILGRRPKTLLIRLLVWYGQITRIMAKNYGPEHVKAWHTNMPM